MKRARNCSRVMRPAARGESVSREFQATRLGAAEALNFEHDAVVSGFFDAEQCGA